MSIVRYYVQSEIGIVLPVLLRAKGRDETRDVRVRLVVTRIEKLGPYGQQQPQHGIGSARTLTTLTYVILGTSLTLLQGTWYVLVAPPPRGRPPLASRPVVSCT